MDTLAVIDQPLNDFELISFFLANIGSNHDSYIPSVTTIVDSLSFKDLYDYFLVYEFCLEKT